MRVEIKKLELPKVSQAGMRVLEILAKEDFQINDLAAVVCEDTTLAAILIKYANSPLYRRYVEIASVPRAISVLGIKNVKMAVTVAAMRSLSRTNSKAIARIWDHSVSIAMACKLIAGQVCRVNADDFEFTGIVHDIGLLTMAANFPKQYDALLHRSAAEAIPIDALEHEAFEFSRAELIDWIAKNLRLPTPAILAAKAFYGLEAAPLEGDARQQQLVLALAHALDQQTREGDAPPLLQTAAESRQHLCRALKLSDQDFEELAGKYREVLDAHFLL